MRQHLLVANLALSVCCFCQTRGNVYLRGEVQHDAADRVDDLSVEIYDLQSHSAAERAFVMPDGSFEFRQVATGNYEMRLVDRSGNTIRSEYASLNPGSSAISFNISQERKKPVSGAVSAAQLGHQENRKAMHEYHAALKDCARGKMEAAVLHLRRSIAIDPEFAPAHHRLAVTYISQGEHDKALLEFRKTVELDPGLAVGHSNLSLALLQTGAAGQAETEARKAVQLDPSYPNAHYLLALSLIRQQKLKEETVGNLRQSGPSYPQAQALAERLEAQLARH